MICTVDSSLTKFAAISFDTATLNDLQFYMQKEGIELTVIHPEEFLQSQILSNFNFINLVILDMNLRQEVSSALTDKKCLRFSYIHDQTLVDGSTIGFGSFIYPQSAIYPTAVLGSDSIIHSQVMVAHKVQIGNGCVISCGTLIGGSSVIGNYCRFGLGVTVYDHLSIAGECSFGARTIIKKDVVDSGRFRFDSKDYLVIE